LYIQNVNNPENELSALNVAIVLKEPIVVNVVCVQKDHQEQNVALVVRLLIRLKKV
jgi:hypothetical protein